MKGSAAADSTQAGGRCFLAQTSWEGALLAPESTRDACLPESLTRTAHCLGTGCPASTAASLLALSRSQFYAWLLTVSGSCPCSHERS